jgi:penicillin-binding protein 2
VKICGKTGTAQASKLVVDMDGDGRPETIVRSGDHAWFAGFAPYKKPKVAFVVILEYAGSGGSEAVPLAKEVLRLCRKYGYLENATR